MRVLVLIVGLLAIGGFHPVCAAPVFLAYDFAATNVSVEGTGSAPVDPVKGSFSLTFDSSQPEQSATSGLNVTGLNIASDSGPESAFNGIFNYIEIATHIIYPGGHTTAGLLDPLANDFSLDLSLYPTVHPGFFSYTQADGSIYFTSDVTLTPTLVSEPSSLALLCSVLTAVCMVHRRRA